MTTGLTTDWLAARLGEQPARVEARRRAGELVGVRRDDGQHVYPGWQFGRDGKPHSQLPTLIAAARAKGLDDAGLDELLTRRAGLVGSTPRAADAVRAGDLGPAFRAVAAA
jgi:hypothetical protein